MRLVSIFNCAAFSHLVSGERCSTFLLAVFRYLWVCTDGIFLFFSLFLNDKSLECDVLRLTSKDELPTKFGWKLPTMVLVLICQTAMIMNFTSQGSLSTKICSAFAVVVMITVPVHMPRTVGCAAVWIRGVLPLCFSFYSR